MGTTRRGLITGLIAFVAAPAIVRAGSLMPVKVMLEPVRYITVTPDPIRWETFSSIVIMQLSDGRQFWHDGAGWVECP